MRRSLRVALVVAFVAAVLVPALDPTPAWAAAPANDAFAGAAVVGGPLPIGVAGTNVEATKEPSEPNHAGNAGGRSVWYRWVPDATALVHVETCAASGFDTLLAVYTGDAIGGLTLVAGNDDACSARSRVAFTAVAGQTYHVAVDGFNGASGAFQLTLRANLPGPNAPPNDDFDAAQVLSGPLPVDVSGTNVDASKEAFEPDHAGNTGGASVWYAWSPESSGIFAAETCGSAVDTVLAVYTGAAVDALSAVAGNDNSSGCTNNRHSKATFSATAGTTYLIAVDGAAGVTGAIALRVRAANPPTNDDFADAQEVGGTLPAFVTGTNVDATSEPGEPNHAGSAGGSVWYRWTPTLDGPYLVETCHPSINTVLAVYTGASVDALTTVGSNDNTSGACNSGSALLSSVAFEAVAGTPYSIAVAGAGGSTGTIAVRLRAANPPANDDFSNAQVVGGPLPIGVAGTNLDATFEAGEPTHADFGTGGASIWYRWTPAAGGVVVIETCQTTVNTLLAVYTGAAIDGLTLVARNDNTTNCGTNGFGSRVTVSAVAGTTYQIAVDGRSAAMGEIGVAIRAPGAVGNDSFANAAVLPAAVPLSTTGVNVDATKEAGEPAHAGNSGGSSLWYRWTPEVSQLVVVETCGSSFNTLLAVYTGETVARLTPVAANDDTGNCAGGVSVRGSRVLFPAAAGTTYRIAVDGSNGATGTIQLRARAADPPVNDAFADAVVLAGALPILASGDTVDATKEPGEPNHGGHAGGASVWYTWTSDASGTVVVSTCGSANLSTVVGVYTGSAVDALTAVPGVTESPCGSRLQVRFAAGAGQTYRIAVDARLAETGPFVLSIRNAPSNDDFADAQVLGGPLPIEASGSTLDASGQAGEPAHAGWSARQSIWYRWTAPSSGWVAVDTCGSTFDTVLGVYTGAAVNALAAVGANDNGCQRQQSRVVFAAVGGQTYHIAVDGPTPVTTDVGLRIGAAAPPAHDDFADARLLTGVLPIEVVEANVDATRQPGEPSHAGQTGGGSLWYRWTPDATDVAVVDLCNSRFDTLVAVYTGTALDDLAPVAGNDDRCGQQAGSYTRFAATAGQTYWIAVDGKLGARGAVVMALRHPPSNDDFGAAGTLVATLPTSVHGDNRDSALEPSEPEHTTIVPSPTRSVWFTWTPQASGPVVIERCGTDQVLAVYTGSALAGLTPVGSNPDGTNCGVLDRGMVALEATAGTTYRIAVAAFQWGGPFELAIHAPDATRPPNDAFADAQVLGGEMPIKASGTNTSASEEPDEPDHGGDAGGTSVWYAWTADVTGPIAVETCASDFDTLLGVYTGDALGALAPIAGNDDGCGLRSTVRFTATLGQTYRIAVDGYAARTGQIELVLGRDERPPNDAFASAQALSGPLPLSAGGTNFHATTEAGEPAHTDRSDPGSIWYRWTAHATGPVVVETCGSDLRTALAVYTGGALTALTVVAGNAETSGCGEHRASRVVVPAAAGVTYHIAVTGRSADVGRVALAIRSAHPPANDDFADAEQLSGPFPIDRTVTNVDATEEVGEPHHGSSEHDRSGASVWYRWTAPDDGRVAFETCGTTFPTLLGVYAGDTLGQLTRVPGSESTCGDHLETRTIITATAGRTYHVAVAGSYGGSGTFTLRIRPAAPAANDDFAGAQVLSGALPVTLTTTNVDATDEPSGPMYGAGDGKASLWFGWTAPTSGRVAVTTCASDFDSLVSVYTGTSLRNIVDLAAPASPASSASPLNECDGDRRNGRLVFPALGGERYWFKVSGDRGDTGSVVLSLTRLPANDDIGRAQTIDATRATSVTGTNVDATREPGEPAILGNDGGHSVWYRFTPAASGSYVVDTCDSSFDTLLAVFTGRAVNRLDRVASNDDSCGGQSRVKIGATAGRTYWIAVEGVDGAAGSVRVFVRPDRGRAR